MSDSVRVPQSTYRLQMHGKFTFDDAAAVADYLAALGVTHVYTSPYLQAAPGSTHGYDVMDHRRVNEELGGQAGHVRFCERLGKAGLGQVLDIVPNHMSIAGRGNAWWWDVLENGQSSRYASYFDVDWDSPQEKLRNMVLLPILGDQYGRVLEAGGFHVERHGGTFTLHYADHVLPLAPRSLDGIVAAAATRCQSELLAFLAESYSRLPISTATDRVSVVRRHRDKEVLRAQIERACAEQPEVARAIDEVIAELNANYDALDQLIERQNYRPALWRTAGQELDYRRFFDINTLVSVRMEDEHVFYDTHYLVLDWLKRGVLDGVRIDHIDGLRDPDAYLERLHQAAPQAWIVVEKILEPGEHLPESWHAEGTTGYDFIHRLDGLFVQRRSEQPLTEFYGEFTGEPTDYPAVVRDKKHQVLKQLFGSDMNRLTAMLAAVAERHRRYRDYTRPQLHTSLREVLACFPVYRTYARAETGTMRDEDRRYVEEAIERAKQYRPDLDPELFDFLRDLLTLKYPGTAEREFVMRLQQHSGPIMAKGVEDTVFYNFNRLISLNEVGGDPGQFGISLAEFHAACRESQAHWPRAMLASTTHDTKRSEDVRARINLLTEIADPWLSAVRRWAELNERHRHDGIPDRNTEYLLYQTLVGAWPIEEPRTQAYMLKAVREAKQHTSWTDNNEAYEKPLEAFIHAVYESKEFITELERFVAPLVHAGRVASLNQTAIRMTAPGVPDVYQGTEIWAHSLVDPDNRRPVDYALRRRLLGELESMLLERVVERYDEGLPKLFVVQRLLRLRRRLPEAFGPDGDYEPLTVKGPRAEHVVAFMRGGRVATIAHRWPLTVKAWEDTACELPAGVWRNELSGEVFRGAAPLEALYRQLPVAVLVRED